MGCCLNIPICACVCVCACMLLYICISRDRIKPRNSNRFGTYLESTPIRTAIYVQTIFSTSRHDIATKHGYCVYQPCVFAVSAQDISKINSRTFQLTAYAPYWRQHQRTITMMEGSVIRLLGKSYRVWRKKE